jgi:hypothetical protein
VEDGRQETEKEAGEGFRGGSDGGSTHKEYKTIEKGAPRGEHLLRSTQMDLIGEKSVIDVALR